MHRERRAVTRAQGRIALTICLATTVITVTAVSAGGQTKPRVDPAQPCCSIVSIDGAAATATARNTVTGQLLTFAVTDNALLQSLHIGEPIYFNARTRQVGVSYGQPCCNVVSQSVSRPVGVAPLDGATQPVSALPPNDLKPTNVLHPDGVAPIDGNIRAVDPVQPCCNVVANSALNSHMGRVVLNFPASTDYTSVEILQAGSTEKIGGWSGTGALEVGPGTYDVAITNKVVHNVHVQAGHDTQIKVGVVRIKGGGNAAIDLLDSDQKTKLAGAFGGFTVGLPVGTYTVKMPGLAEKVTVRADKITDF